MWHAIHDILWNEWDPIGVNQYSVASDEYDNYIPQLIQLLESAADQYKLTQYLAMIESKAMGLDERPERNHKIAARLVEEYHRQLD